MGAGGFDSGGQGHHQVRGHQVSFMMLGLACRASDERRGGQTSWGEASLMGGRASAR